MLPGGGCGWEPLESPPGLWRPEMQEGRRGLVPRLLGKESGHQELAASSPDGWAPTFLELDLQGVRGIGGFARVLGLCVEAWRRLVLTKDRKRMEARCSEPSGAMPVPGPPVLHLLRRCAPLCRTGGLLAPCSRPLSPQPVASPTCQGPGKQRAQEIRQFFPST